MGVSTRHKSPSPREFLFGRGNVQKRSRQDTHQPSNSTPSIKRSRNAVFDPSLARIEEMAAESADSGIDNVEQDRGHGQDITSNTIIGPVTLDARTAVAVQHLIFDGPEHPLYAGHIDAIISHCDVGTIADSEYELQRVCEFLHAQAAALNQVPKGSQLEEELRTVWVKKHGQDLAEMINGTSAYPDVIAAMIMGQADDHKSSDKIKEILRAVQNQCDKHAQATMVDDNVPQDSAGPDEHLDLPYHPDIDAPAANGVKPVPTYRPLSVAYCLPFGAAPYQSFSTASFAQQVPKTTPTEKPTGFDRSGFSAGPVAAKAFSLGPAAEANRSFPRSVSAFSTGEPPNGSGTASSDQEKPRQKQSAVQNSNGTGGSVNGRYGYGHPLHNWVVKPAIKVEEFEENDDGPAHYASAPGARAHVHPSRHPLQQVDLPGYVVLDTGDASNKKDRIIKALKSTFKDFGWASTTRLPDRRWLIRLGDSNLARQAASRAFDLRDFAGLITHVQPRLYMDPKVYTAVVSSKTIMPDLLIAISTLYKKPFCLQYSDNSPFSFIMVLTLSEKISAKTFLLRVATDGSSKTVQFTGGKIPAGRLETVPTPPQAEAQAHHLNTPPTAT
ncbi:hypothetical protein KC333_g4627 [Hortaea werneckii]|nr:hypothetical protein KC333_g4627 [Hortaea werneckii]KAI7316035.1 hypothetical protein KC326_g4494 [Hortaea werneckii]